MRVVVAVAVSASLVMTLPAMSSASSQASSAADKRIAKAGVLTLQDFPRGWAVNAHSAASSSTLLGKLISKTAICRQFEPLFANNKAATRAQSPSSFTDGEFTVDNSVAVYPDVAQLLGPCTAIKTTTFRDCAQQLYDKVTRTQLASSDQLPVDDLAVVAQSASPEVRVGDDQAARAITVTLTDEGISENSYTALIVIRVGRTLDTFNYTNGTRPITATEPTVIGSSVARLQSALGPPEPRARTGGR
jgi:hypothetical protein